ncbi:quinoprotein relay system zinc metallohydrolase 2 [Anderseniella sp. Alg231-50]|uniref:quinoprotein relay system zinc metallohydrolase 2 n=1 Tax=Anderseniella sp. Alg231-50 TaxID=1922226 RepID=UPI00307B354B
MTVSASVASTVRADTATVTVDVTEIAQGVFVHAGAHELFTPENSGDISNMGFIIGGEAVAVVDTGGSRAVGLALKAAIRARTSLPIKYVINTHMHPDHVFGNSAFTSEKPEFIGHHKLTSALAARKDQYLQANKPLLGAAFDGVEIIPPGQGIKGVEYLDLGNRKLRLEAHATAHTDNDLTVLDEQTATMFMGDLLFSGHVPVIDGSITGWLDLMDRLAAEKITRVVPGHGPAAMPWPDALAEQKRYLNGLVTQIRDYIERGVPLSRAAREIGLDEKQAWLLFDDFNARNVSAAFAELEWE